MDQSAASPEARYAAIVAMLCDNPDVTHASDVTQSRKSFGTTELKIHGKIFAMLNKSRLVVKLPKPRVDALIASGVGERFDPRHDGRLMKEWVTIDPTTADQWLALAQEALEFVSAKR